MKFLAGPARRSAGGHEHGEHEHGGHHEHGEHEQHAEDAGAVAHAHHGHDHEAAGGIEWEDDMVEVNKLTTPANTRWKLVDRSDDAENHDDPVAVSRRRPVKIRLVNEMDSDHPMHHPFHIHGAGRFLVLAATAWSIPIWSGSDTVLVRTGETVDIVLDVTNAGSGWRTATSPSTTRAG